ncbi:MAG: hypothetical protein KDC10_02400 [Calditrichaeota bacterium]|nr:hypothetical protein [Candidatus Cloacimonadota bacterium]MCB1046027.1 hypothetical protein [Calditrichota bacterium]
MYSGRAFPAFLMLTLAGVASAQSLEVGVMVGEPTGLNGKIWLDARHAVDAGLAWSLQSQRSLHAHADWLIHDPEILAGSQIPGEPSLYYGVGGRLSARDHGRDHLGVRIPVGLAWRLPGAPLAVFFELAPVVDLVPDTGLDVEGGLGLRYCFPE